MENWRPMGYNIGYGWKGLMPDGNWQLFSSEEEYLEIVREQ